SPNQGQGGHQAVTQTQPRHLFVYGTLMRGSRSPYAKLLRARAQFLGEGWVPGRLFHLGRFPGAIFDESSTTKVRGEVYRLGVPKLLAALDAYEGCAEGMGEVALFRRQRVEARLTQGGVVAAWAYAFARGTGGRIPIPSGRFAPAEPRVRAR